MEKTTFIKEFGSLGNNAEKRQLFSALVTCLEPEEASQLLFWSLGEEKTKRFTVLAKIRNDMESKVQDCHIILIKRLIEELDILTYNKKPGSKQFCGNLRKAP